MADMAVLHGPLKAVEILQKILAGQGLDPGPVDGVCGPRTAQAAIKMEIKYGPASFIDRLVNARCRYVRAIVEKDPSQQVFLNGWLARAQAFWVSHKG